MIRFREPWPKEYIPPMFRLVDVWCGPQIESDDEQTEYDPDGDPRPTPPMFVERSAVFGEALNEFFPPEPDDDASPAVRLVLGVLQLHDDEPHDFLNAMHLSIRRVAGYVNPEGTGAIFPDEVYSHAEVVGFCGGSETEADEIFAALGQERSDTVWGHELREKVEGYFSAEDLLARIKGDEEE